jgi:hypothetical protein
MGDPMLKGRDERKGIVIVGSGVEVVLPNLRLTDAVSAYSPRLFNWLTSSATLILSNIKRISPNTLGPRKTTKAVRC